MKKTILFILLFVISNNFFAQTLLSENFSPYVLGNIGTDIDGTNAGQGGWYTRTLVNANGNNNNFQIVDVAGANGKVLQITGYNGAAAVPSNSRFMYKSIASAWINRDFGNEITEIEYDFFTGPVTTSANVMRVALYDSAISLSTAKVLAGFIITMNTRALRGLCWYDPTSEGSTGAIGSYSLALGSNGATPPVLSELILAADTWYRIGFSYNSSNGQVKFIGPGIGRNTVQGATVAAVSDSIYVLGSTGGTSATPNNASSTGTFDNIVVRASSTDTLLAIDAISLENNTFTISPNPADKFINISNTENINISEIKITDLNGRIVKTEKVSNVANIEINVANLTTGMYLMNINTEKGIVTKKIMKN